MDYKFYEMEYGGKTPFEQFLRLLIQAMNEVKCYTLNRANDSDIIDNYILEGKYEKIL
ncbi:hypothetical protein [Senegalia massiliensis]|uniref:hypothetical protein n=1 Tax=Senegalia massiliensis TaxID=1720316 RepID=UPI0013642BDF|nr:hypothetical protein [Senegalia massiliensis]